MRTKPLNKYYTPICVSIIKQNEAINYVFDAVTSLVKEVNPKNPLVVYKDKEEAEDLAIKNMKEGMAASVVAICQYPHKIIFECFGAAKEIPMDNFFENFCEVFE